MCEFDNGFEAGREYEGKEIDKEYDVIKCDFCGVTGEWMVVGPGRTERLFKAYICRKCATEAVEEFNRLDEHK